MTFTTRAGVHRVQVKRKFRLTLYRTGIILVLNLLPRIARGIYAFVEVEAQ